MPYCELLSVDPPVVVQSLKSPLEELDWPLPQRAYRLFVFPASTNASAVRKAHRRLREKWPGHVVHYLMNEAVPAQRLRREGLPVHCINMNLIVDEARFRVQPAERFWTAVYVARFNPMKRHELAADIPRAAFAGGVSERWDPPGYDVTIRSRCPRAQMLGWVRGDELVWLLNRSRVGLCLSASEGAMRVAVEYQFCGLPVVTTHNRGGRNECLDPRFSRTVAPNAAAVAAAVAEVASLRLCPHEVRAAALRRMQAHRRRYIDLVQSVFDRAGVHDDFDRRFDTGQTGHMFHASTNDVARYLRTNLS